MEETLCKNVMKVRVLQFLNRWFHIVQRADDLSKTFFTQFIRNETHVVLPTSYILYYFGYEGLYGHADNYPRALKSR